MISIDTRNRKSPHARVMSERKINTIGVNHRSSQNVMPVCGHDVQVRRPSYYRKYMIIWFHDMISEIYGFEKRFKIFFNCNVCNSTWRFLSIVVLLVFEAKQKKWITDSSKVEYTVNTLVLQTIFSVSKSTDNDASGPCTSVRKQKSNGSYVYTQFFLYNLIKTLFKTTGFNLY